MRLAPSFFALLLLLLLVVASACNAKVANVLESSPTSDGGGDPSGSGIGSSTSGAACQTAAECNDDPSISTLYGRCENGRCVCDAMLNPSQAPFTPRGKCGPQAPDCTIGQDQTCNASPQMSALAGRCVNGKCECNPSFAKNFAGKCGATPASPPSPKFPDFVPGLWLIGWSGGLDHFSWVRITADNGGQAGKTIYRTKPSDKKGVTPYWDCDAQGTWMVTAKLNTIFLTFSEMCEVANPNVAHSYTFGPIDSNPTFVKTALLQVNFETEPGQQSLIGLKFPDDTCNATLTQCADPFVGN
jgi:hypothetical protein